MQIKDVIISILAGYAATTLPIWETDVSMLAIGAVCAWACLCTIDAVDDWQHKRKKRHRNGSSGSAIKK